MVRNPFRSRRETRRRPREAVDAETVKDVRSEAAEEDVEPDSEALREAAAEETAEVAESVARRARRRGRKTSLPRTLHRRTNDIKTAKNADGADNDRSRIRPCPVLPSD